MPTTYDPAAQLTPEHRNLYATVVRFTHARGTPSPPYDIEGAVGIVIGWVRRQPEDEGDLPCFDAVICEELGENGDTYSRMASPASGFERIDDEIYRSQVTLFLDRDQATASLERDIQALQKRAEAAE